MSSYERLSDLELLKQVQGKNEHAFKVLYTRYWAVLYRHALRMTGSEEESKDILQDLFAELWDHAAGLDIQRTLSGYLYTSVRNKVLNSMEKQRIRSLYKHYSLGLEYPGANLTEETLRYKELQELIEGEVAKLPLRMQQVFLLSRQQHRSYKEIATELKLSENTVRKQISNALKVLRIKLGTFFQCIFICFF